MPSALDQASQVSARYIIDKNGDIFRMVEDSEKAWHAKSANSRSIGIEHVTGAGERMTPEQQESSVALIRWLMSAYDNRPDGITGHRFAPGNAGTTDCPDHLFGNAARARSKRGLSPTSVRPPLPMLGAPQNMNECEREFSSCSAGPGRPRNWVAGQY